VCSINSVSVSVSISRSRELPGWKAGHQLSLTSIRLAWTSLITGVSVIHLPATLWLRHVLVYHPSHQPRPKSPAWCPGEASLSLSGVLNSIPLAIMTGFCAVARASPASPLYPATVSRYLPTSSLMENVEYSAEYHRPVSRWIYSQTRVSRQ